MIQKAKSLVALRSAFANRNFAIYAVCNLIFVTGSWMQRLTVGWLTWELTQSELWIGAVAFAELFPVMFVGPVAGVWVDRPVRRKLAKLCQAFLLLQTSLLFIFSMFDMITIELLFGLVLFSGHVSAVYQPVRLSVVPCLLRGENLVAGVSFTSISFNMARLVGPAIAGTIIAIYGLSASFFAVVLTVSIMFVAWFYIDIPPRKWPQNRVERSVIKEFREGVHYVLRHRAVAYILLVQAVIALCARPIGELLPAYVGSVFSQGAGSLAMLTSCMGIGAVLAGLHLSFWDSNNGLVRLTKICTALSGVSVICFSLSQNLWLSAIIICFAGYMITLSSIASQALMQGCVDELMRGRVLSIWVAISRGAPGLGALIIGGLSSSYGLVWPSVLVASLCVVAAAWMYTHGSMMRSHFEVS